MRLMEEMHWRFILESTKRASGTHEVKLARSFNIFLSYSLHDGIERLT